MKYRKILALLLVAVLLICALPSVAHAAGKSGWKKENGSWYYYRNGKKVTGWIKDGNFWYYMDRNGKMAEGWRKVGGKWYYLVPGYGFMAVCNHKINGKWYFFDEVNGDMKTGWIRSEDEDGYYWVYCNPSGDAAVGWKKIGGVWYYFNIDDSGLAQSTVPHMVAGRTLNINGVDYTFASSGAWIK